MVVVVLARDVEKGGESAREEWEQRQRHRLA